MGCGNISPVKDQRQRSIRQLADEEKQAGIQGQWQQESPAREYLEQVKCCHDTDCNESMMKKEYKETFKEKMRASEWAFERIEEAFDLVAKDEVEKMSIVQEIMLKSTNCLRRIIAPFGGQGGVTMSNLCPNCNSFTLGRQCLVGLCWKEAHQLMVCDLWSTLRLEATEQAFGCQTGESVEQAKVF